MGVDTDPRWGHEAASPAGPETPSSVAAESEAGVAPSEAVWGQRSLSVGSGCLFLFGGCVVCSGLLLLFLLTSDTEPEATGANEDAVGRGVVEGGAVEQQTPEGIAALGQPLFAGGPPGPGKADSGPREGGLSYGGPTLKTLDEIALDELGRLDGKGRQNEAGEYVEVELRGGVYDNDLKQVARLKSLQILHLIDTQISGEGCKSLVGLKSLRELDLAGSPITDRGLQQVIRLLTLRRLDLRDTRITFDGVLSLNKLPGLKTLVLSPGQFSQRRLRGRLPGCKITWQVRPDE